MLQLQEVEDRKTPAATTWAAEFLLRKGESREFLGLWITSGAIHEAKKRRATQIITCSFPCGKWLHCGWHLAFNRARVPSCMHMQIRPYDLESSGTELFIQVVRGNLIAKIVFAIV
jgi:hypothetical protein